MEPHNAFNDIMAKGYDLDLNDAYDISFLLTVVDVEMGARMLDAVRLIICDPIYQGPIPFDYFD